MRKKNGEDTKVKKKVPYAVSFIICVVVFTLLLLFMICPIVFNFNGLAIWQKALLITSTVLFFAGTLTIVVIMEILLKKNKTKTLSERIKLRIAYYLLMEYIFS